MSLFGKQPQEKESDVYRQRVAWRDLEAGMNQQMFFWGYDVVSAQGNGLLEFGLRKKPSEGLQGTSCYYSELPSGVQIELHGACAAWYVPGEAGCVYVRYPRGFYYVEKGVRIKPGDRPENVPALRRAQTHEWKAHQRRVQDFLRWIVTYEKWIKQSRPSGYRLAAYNQWMNRRLARPWFPPEEAVCWFQKASEGAWDALPRPPSSRRKSLHPTRAAAF